MWAMTLSRASVSIHQAAFSDLMYEMQPDNQSGKQAFHTDGSKHFLTKLSYGMYSVQQSITDDKGLCHGVIEQILKKIARCFHALQSQLGGKPPICSTGIICYTHRSSSGLTRNRLLIYTVV